MDSLQLELFSTPFTSCRQPTDANNLVVLFQVVDHHGLMIVVEHNLLDKDVNIAQPGILGKRAHLLKVTAEFALQQLRITFKQCQ